MVGAGVLGQARTAGTWPGGHHVHPAAMVWCCCVREEEIVLITDAIQATGMPDGQAYDIVVAEERRSARFLISVVHTASVDWRALSGDAADAACVELTAATPAGAPSIYGASCIGAYAQLLTMCKGSLKPKTWPQLPRG